MSSVVLGDDTCHGSDKPVPPKEKNAEAGRLRAVELGLRPSRRLYTGGKSKKTDEFFAIA